MTTVLCLGGTGQFGLPTARFLAADPRVDRVILAGRDLAKARAAADAVGPKADVRVVDADDPTSLAAAMEGVTVVASTLWEAEGRSERVARAAVQAGAHYCDLNDDAQPEELSARAEARGVTLLTRVGTSPGLTDLAVRHLLDGIDEPKVLISLRYWHHLLDAWADLFDAYVELPGGRTRGPLGRQLYGTLTNPSRDPARLAAVLRDACVVPFWLAILGDPGHWLATLPAPRDGELADAEIAPDGLEIDLLSGGTGRDVPTVATDGGTDDAGVRRISVNGSGMSATFDSAVRAAAARVAEGADVAAETRELEDAIADDPEAYVRPADDVAALPSLQYLAFGRDDSRLVRGSLVLREDMVAPERFLDITAASLALTVRYLLDETITVRGAHTLDDVIADVDAFFADYVDLVPGFAAGTPLVTQRVDAV